MSGLTHATMCVVAKRRHEIVVDLLDTRYNRLAIVLVGFDARGVHDSLSIDELQDNAGDHLERCETRRGEPSPPLFARDSGPYRARTQRVDPDFI